MVQFVFGSPSTNQSVTAKQAAALIVEVIRLDRENESLKFGIDLKVQKRLAALHEQQQKVLHHLSASSSRVSVELAGRE